MSLGIFDEILAGLPDNARLRAEIEKLTSERDLLQSKVVNLELELDYFKHPNDISEVGNNILQHLATKGPCCGVSDLASLLGLPIPDVEVHCGDLRIRGLVYGQPNLSHLTDNWQPTFCITDKGKTAAMNLRH